MPPWANDYRYIWLLPVEKENVRSYDVSDELLWCCIVSTFGKGHVSVNVVWLALYQFVMTNNELFGSTNW